MATTEESTMGRTTEKVTVQNLRDIFRVDDEEITPDEMRTVEIDAIVDTGAAYLCLPPKVIEELGLRFSHSRQVRTANGIVERRLFTGAVITIQGRNDQMSVMENDESTPPLIGYLVLEMFDFVVDPKSQRLIPNPANDGKWITDMF